MCSAIIKLNFKISFSKMTQFNYPENIRIPIKCIVKTNLYKLFFIIYLMLSMDNAFTQFFSSFIYHNLEKRQYNKWSTIPSFFYFNFTTKYMRNSFLFSYEIGILLIWINHITYFYFIYLHTIHSLYFPLYYSKTLYIQIYNNENSRG